MTFNSDNLTQSMKDDVSDYVAHLQLHMSLQSRNLLPSMNQVKDNRNNLLYQTQATIEKHTSRELA
ncbi:hypothetical protein [Geminocystis sp. GBBB08]|uniref:hypothetical protein n=1 Tax=Geminocystis sp. GBBB08 TaxID=2604140 RepID=UPI0027E2B792|nr:hypothetical protein [Geminocystis sp. GBBB08]MBL1209548.1 hypothetical protein [Geminocystis sp. GBBB08]